MYYWELPVEFPKGIPILLHKKLIRPLSGHLQDTFGNVIGKPQMETPKGNPLLLPRKCQETLQNHLRIPPRHLWEPQREIRKGNPKGKSTITP